MEGTGKQAEKKRGYSPELERGMYFDKKTYEDSALEEFGSLKGKLPQPVLPGKAEWTACYDYAVEVLFSNRHVPTLQSGFVSNFVDAAFNEDIFLWDTCFMTLFCNLFHPHIPGIRSLDNFYCKQFEDGEIPRELVRDTGRDFLLWVNTSDMPLYSYFHSHYGHRRLREMDALPYEALYKPHMGRTIEKNPYLTLDNLNHPILAFAEWESYCHTGDVARLERTLEPLYRYYSAMKYHLRHVSGLYVTDWASMDNSPRNQRMGLALDTSSEMALFARNLLDILHVLEMERGIIREEWVRELEEDLRDLRERVNSAMWDEETGFYHDLTFEGECVRVKTIAAFWTLLSGVAEGERAERLSGWLKDEKTFNRLHRVPVLAADEPDYDPEGGYWKGSVWAPTNAMVVLGLERCGESALAKEIALNHVDMVAKVFMKTGTIWENYPADSVSSGNADHKDFVGWSGIGPILFLLRYGIGLHRNPRTSRLVWTIDEDLLRTGPVGCRNYWFGGNTVDLTAEWSGDRVALRVRAEKAFDLEVRFLCAVRIFHVDTLMEVEL